MFNSDGCYFEGRPLETKGGPSASLFSEETLSCQVILGADRPAVTFYFGFHPGLEDTRGIQWSHTAHPGSFPPSSAALSVASTAHLRGFAMHDALRRRVNRRLLCPASLHSQVGFMRGSFEMSCCFEICKIGSW